MKELMKNKKKIIIILLVLVIVLIGLAIIKEMIEKEINEKIELGTTLYEKVHNLYFYGGEVEYKTENNTRKYIEIDYEKYYEISNYEESFKSYITDNMLLKTGAFLNIKEIENKYYMKDYGRGLSGYYGTELKIKSMRKNKVEYKALSKFCEIEYQVSYGDGCSSDKYYYIEKPFILVKENNRWKIEEYTSIFEFDETLIK